MSDTFRALVLEQRDGETEAGIRDVPVDDLPEGEVLVDVAYSTLNYKDGLAITGTGKVIRNFPMVPGVDLAGTVLASSSDQFAAGDSVVLTGFGVGERHWGGMAQRARLKAEWLVPLPDGLTLQQTMAIGTAGITSMLCVMALEEAGMVAGGDVLVTGAAGGVGSVAVALLARQGCKVHAVSGRAELAPYLKQLGATEVIDRKEVSEPTKRPLESARWDAAVDAVGGATLAGLLKSMKYGAPVAACGNAGGVALETTIFPFILRGVKLIGVESVYCPLPRRKEAWRRLASELDPELIDSMTQVVPLADVPDLAREIIRGQVKGRVVVDVNA